MHHVEHAAGKEEDRLDWKLELVVVPVSNVDRAKAFYMDNAGFELHVDHRDGEFRVVQLTPRGSACSIAIMANEKGAGSVHGLHLVVSDIEAARAELEERGAAPSGIFHFEQGRQQPGPDPGHGDYNSFCSFDDPDHNTWLVQEVAAPKAV